MTLPKEDVFSIGTLQSNENPMSCRLKFLDAGWGATLQEAIDNAEKHFRLNYGTLHPGVSVIFTVFKNTKDDTALVEVSENAVGMASTIGLYKVMVQAKAHASPSEGL